MNEIERDQICASAVQALNRGVGSLSNFPGLLEKIIENRAWERRQIRTGRVVELKSLAELITRPPLEGWGEEIAKVEAVIKDSPEALRRFRETLHVHGGDHGNQHTAKESANGNNVTVAKRQTGNSKAYTLQRLARDNPELYQRVLANELSANAAAIEAGWRRKRTPLDELKKWYRKATEEEWNAFIEWLDECDD